MKVKFFGHNCFFLQGKTQSILIDPWLTDKGAFFGSWFQYPKNHNLQDDILNLIKRYEVIGAAAGSLFVFKGIYKAVLINYFTQDEINKLDQNL